MNVQTSITQALCPVVVKHRTGDAIFTAEVKLDTPSRMLGYAMIWGHDREIDMRGADFRKAHILGKEVLSGLDLRCCDLRGACFRYSTLFEPDFRNADLSGADFREVSFRGALLSGSVVRGTRFSLEGVPVVPDIHAQVYARASAEGALDMETWHTCETTHCRAGWVVHLAGKQGSILERVVGTEAAATLIYLKSDPSMTDVPGFHEHSTDALQGMREMAKVLEVTTH